MFEKEYIQGKTRIVEDFGFGKTPKGFILTLRDTNGVCNVLLVDEIKRLIRDGQLMLVNRRLSTDNKLILRSKNGIKAMSVCYALYKPAVRKAIKDTAVKLFSNDGLNQSIGDDMVVAVSCSVSSSIAEEISDDGDKEILEYRCMPDDSMRKKALTVAKLKPRLLMSTYISLAIKEYVKYVEKTTV